MHRILGLALTACLALPAVADAPKSQGGFSVFGPSAEREAFFADQKRAEDEEVAAIRERRLEVLRLEQEAREAEARLAEAARPAAPATSVRNPYFHCVRVPKARVPKSSRGPNLSQIGIRKDGPVACRSYSPYTPYPVYRPHNRTVLKLGLDDGNVSGALRIRRPGLQVNIDVD